jgi:hypothetical protein
MKSKSVLAFLLLSGLSLAQSGSSAAAPNAASATRQATIRNYLDVLEQRQRVNRMPGSGPTVEEKLLRVLAEEVISLRQENDALKQTVAPSKQGH